MTASDGRAERRVLGGGDTGQISSGLQRCEEPSSRVVTIKMKGRALNQAVGPKLGGGLTEERQDGGRCHLSNENIHPRASAPPTFTANINLASLATLVRPSPTNTTTTVQELLISTPHLYFPLKQAGFADSSQVIIAANSRFPVIGDEGEQLLLHSIFTDLFIHPD